MLWVFCSWYLAGFDESGLVGVVGRLGCGECKVCRKLRGGHLVERGVRWKQRLIAVRVEIRVVLWS